MARTDEEGGAPEGAATAAELERQRELLEEAQQVAQLGSWEWDLRTGGFEASAELHRIFGLEESEDTLTHATFVAYVHPDDLESRARALERGLAGEEPFSYDVRIIRRDGAVRNLHVRARARLGPNGVAERILGTAQDVTESKLLESERREFERRWGESQRLESLGVLAGGIAHDFNNLLVGMLGNASMALAELPPDSPARSRLEAVELSARRAGELTQQLLGYAGKNSFVVQPVDLVALVEETAGLLEAVVANGMRIELDLCEERPAVEIDVTQLRQVVMNLIVNASEASEGRSSSIRVRCRPVTVDRELLRSFVEGDALPPGEYALIEVEDDGSGMSPEVAERIFDPFFSSKAAGRGLGLAGALGILRSHGGAIGVRSAPGEGATFSVLLPLASGGAKAPAPQPVASGAPGTGLVLVVDDQRIIRDVARAMLEDGGYRVVTASDGDEALQIFDARGDEIDAILLDLTMPGRGGAEVLREVRRVRPSLPVVVSSGYAVEALDGTLASVGEIGFVQKPYTRAELLDAVAAALAARG